MKRILAGFLLLISLIVGTLVWQRSRLPDWISQKLKITLSEQFLKGTGAELEDLRFQADLWSFLFGDDGSLSFRVRHHAFVLSGEGPVSIHIEREELRFKYHPVIQIHQEEAALFGAPIQIHITGEVPTRTPARSKLDFKVDPAELALGPITADFSGEVGVTTTEVRARFRGKKAQWKAEGSYLVECSEVEFDFLRSKDLKVGAGCREILAQAPDGSWMALIKNQRSELEADLELNLARSVLRFGESEALLGSVLLPLTPLASHPLKIDVRGRKRLALTWGTLTVQLENKDAEGDASEDWNVDWRLQESDVKSLVDPVVEELSRRRWQVDKLKIAGRGVHRVNFDKHPMTIAKSALRHLHLDLNASFQNPKSQLRALGVDMKFRPGLDRGGKGPALREQALPLAVTVSAEELGWRGLDGRLYPSVLELVVHPESDLQRLAMDGVGEIKLAMKEIDAGFDPLRVQLLPGTKNQGVLERLSFRTALKASTQSVAGVLGKVCLPWPKQWSTSLNLDWKDIQFRGGRLSVNGQTKVSVIGGDIVTGPIEIENALSSARLTRFTTRVRNLQLRELGEPIQFGEMDGTLKGDLEDVELIGFVPRRYRARFELLPNEKREIVFSAVAMKNFVSLFTPEDFSGNIPGPLKELAFGWLSRVLGGYNIKYAGLSLSAVDDAILLETLDPDWMIQKGAQRYLLYGTRFKIPLQSLRYPVVLDAPGLTNFVLHVQSVLSELGRKAKSSNESTPKGDNDVSKEYCNPASDRSE